MNRLFFLIVLSLGLGACSRYASNGEQIYLKSKNGPALNVPAPLTAANISHFYDLPTPDKDPQISIVPPSSLNREEGKTQ